MPTSRVALLAVLVASALRLVAASAIPLSGDEAYYWTWSRHLAFGYVDHPPAVAWLIALGTTLGSGPGFVRWPFVLAEAIAALAVGSCARALGAGDRAGTIATIAFLCIPQQKLAIGEALPDGPYVAAWALALRAAVPLVRRDATLDIRGAIGLGLAMGAALLSRAFAWTLVVGITLLTLRPVGRMSRGAVAVAGALALCCYAPFIVWNATHGWQTFAFTVHDRQAFAGASLGRLALLATLRCALYALPLIFVTWLVALRPPPERRLPLVAATALPLLVGLLVLAPFYPIESYWILGPVASICVGVGVSLARADVGWRRLWAGLGVTAFAVTTGTTLFLALPEATQAAFLAGPGRPLTGSLVSGAFAYEPLARTVRSMTARGGDIVMVDRPEIAAELAYDGVPSEFVGFSPDGVELARYHVVARGAGDALLVRYAPIGEDRHLLAVLRAGPCARIDPGPELVFLHAGVRSERFFTGWCHAPRR